MTAVARELVGFIWAIAAGAIRINANGGVYHSARGEVWGRDRFFSATAPGVAESRRFEDDIARTEDDEIYRTSRGFGSDASDESSFPRGYRVPLPRGRYRVTLHFAETNSFILGLAGDKRNFDVHLEGKRVLIGYKLFDVGLATADWRSFDVTVDDGVLDIEFVRRVGAPLVSAIEIVPLR